MPLNIDLTDLVRAANRKVTSHDNCEVLDLDINGVGSTVFPRDIEVRPGGDDGPRVTAIWDGSIGIAVNDLVVCHEYGEATAWRVVSAGGDKAGELRVSKLYESDFGAVAMQSDADSNVGVNVSSTTYVEEAVTQTGQFMVERENATAKRGAIFSAITDTVGRNAQNQFIKAKVGPAAVADTHRVGDFLWAAHDGTDYVRGARYGAVVDGSVSANTMPMALIFETSETGAVGVAERLRIKPDGKVGIGTSSPDTKLDVNGDMTLSGGSQSYLFTDRSTNLVVQGQSAGVSTVLEYFSKDGDGTDITGINIYGVGTPGSVTNRERLQIRYNSTNLFEIFSEANGTGTLRPLILYTEGNTDQLKLETDGTVSIGDSLETEGERIISSEVLTTTTSMDDTVEVAVLSSATAKTVTLPTHKADKRITLTSTGAGVWTLSPTSGTIKGSSTATLNQHEDLILHSDGTNWI